jgi:hypothetical protein
MFELLWKGPKVVLLEEDMRFEDFLLPNEEMGSFQLSSIFKLGLKKIYDVFDKLRAKAFFDYF